MATSSTTARHEFAGERKHATVLFADVAGFTAISERLGEEAAFEIIQSIRAMMREVVAEFSGTILDFAGDGLLAVFGVPKALEDAPLSACRAALALLSRTVSAAPAYHARYGIDVQLRIGINSGAVVVGHVEAQGGKQLTAVGDAVNVAARLQARAEAGSIILSDVIYQLVDDIAVVTPLGAFSLKGKSEAQHAFRLDALKHVATRFDRSVSRGLSQYVGRENELRTIRDIVATKEGVSVVDIAGDPGMGKSRLLYEFRGNIDQARFVYLAGRCTREGQRTAFFPFIEIVRSWADIAIGEDRRQTIKKLNEALDALGLFTPDRLAILLNLTGQESASEQLAGLDPLQIGLRTRDLLIDLLRAACRMSPTILTIEDLHWIDSSSESLLETIASLQDIATLVVIHTRRSHYAPPWANATNVSSIPLAPLDSAQIVEIVTSRLQVQDISADFVEQIVRQADGNALFAEEIAKFIGESAQARVQPAGRLPVSIQAILGARIELLSDDQRRLLQIASVFGRRFDIEQLAELLELPADVVSREIEQAHRSELLHIDRRTGEAVFSHALLNEVLYGGMLRTDRAVYHLKVAKTIEAKSGGTSENAELLTHHYRQTDRHDRTLMFAAMAARKSLRVYSLVEAEEFAKLALEALTLSGRTNDAALPDLIADYILVLQLGYNIPDLIKVAELWLPRIDAPSLAKVSAMHHYANALLLAGRYQDCKATSEKLDAISNELGDDRSKLYAFTVSVWIGALLATRSNEAIDAQAPAMFAAALRTTDIYLKIWLRWVLSLDAVHRGLLHSAYKYAQELIELGQTAKDSRATGLGLWLQGWNALINDDYALALKFGHEASAAALTPWDRSTAMNLTASALVLTRQLDEGLALLKCRRDLDDAAGRRYAFVANDAVWGAGLVLSGKFRAGIRFIENRIEMREAEGYRSAADWYRVTLCYILLEVLQGGRRPQASVLIRNLPYLIWLKITGLKRIDRLIARARQNPLFHPEGLHQAKVHFIIGSRWRLAGRTELARKSLQEAKRIAKVFGDTPLAAKIDASLDEVMS
ncbi:adenylate cyclase 2 [Variibacter gotjawalensis]|uniref:Adenylate cyclase 2 n=1 Tax=Variibacter gotjawalensis TaxID=1333996 RepID=A0A0S3PTW9_9BRAD|nr:adenylate/guanylate cyclase domain-containing protein [Variibacter gotjawalensis]NIK49702.1 class 3 adenylate cyclase [Variibacter gotjawalensis]RZS45714.1 AAA ATPase-like protein [Variibacter gotjawalensis]BAT59385.1 adenylate cyclase 2 [Variibacter gotjawalensis]